jgi:hypothetical protein
MKWQAISMVAFVAVVGCDKDPVDGPDRLPRMGRYAYDSGRSGDAKKGTFTLTYASDDSIAGMWDVPDYDSPLQGGFWNVDAYWASADLKQYAGIIIHRWRVDSNLNLVCGTARYVTDKTEWESACTLTYLGP